MNYQTVKLGDVCDFLYGEGLTEAQREGGKFPVYGSNGIVGWHNRPLTEEAAIVIGRKGSIGEVHLSEMPCWPIDTTYYVQLKEKPCELGWLYYTLLALNLTKLNKSAAVPGLNRNDAYEKEIPLPPLNEQKRIAAILSKADRLRRLRRYARELNDGYLGSVFLEMFGNPVSDPMRFPIARFGEVCETRLGKMLDAKQQTGENRRPYLRNENVQWGRIDISDVYEMDFDEREREILRLHKGDVLICEGGEVGRAAIWNDELPECYYQKALHRARPNPKLAVPEFILLLMWCS